MAAGLPAPLIVVGNEKGGSGKTTVAIHLVAGLHVGGLARRARSISIIASRAFRISSPIARRGPSGRARLSVAEAVRRRRRHARRRRGGARTRGLSASIGELSREMRRHRRRLPGRGHGVGARGACERIGDRDAAQRQFRRFRFARRRRSGDVSRRRRRRSMPSSCGRAASAT